MSEKEGLSEEQSAVWLSDGGKGFWSMFNEAFSKKAIGVLDFYHAAQNVWKGARAWLDGRTRAARKWFADARGKIREGNVSQVLRELKDEPDPERLTPEDRRTLENLTAYLETHKEHMDYDKFKALGLPIGSGIVESTCKWLIQQRFKGVGMRWSEKGFRTLLHLRLEWSMRDSMTYFRLPELMNTPVGHPRFRRHGRHLSRRGKICQLLQEKPERICCHGQRPRSRNLADLLFRRRRVRHQGDLPETRTDNSDGIAVVIGNKSYEFEQDVEFAVNDARAVKRYLVEVLGYPEGNILYKEDAAKEDFELFFGTSTNHRGQLFNRIEPGRSNVFVYYSGHGAPGPNDKNGYLIPIGAQRNYVELQGYPWTCWRRTLKICPPVPRQCSSTPAFRHPGQHLRPQCRGKAEKTGAGNSRIRRQARPVGLLVPGKGARPVHLFPAQGAARPPSRRGPQRQIDLPGAFPLRGRQKKRRPPLRSLPAQHRPDARDPRFRSQSDIGRIRVNDPCEYRFS